MKVLLPIILVANVIAAMSMYSKGKDGWTIWLAFYSIVALVTVIANQKDEE